MFKKFLMALLASLSLFTANAAQASSAQALSLSGTPTAIRASTDTGDGNQLVAGPAGYLLGALALGLTVWGVVELADDDTPDSP